MTWIGSLLWCAFLGAPQSTEDVLPDRYVAGEILYALHGEAQAPVREELGDLVDATADVDLWPGRIFKMTIADPDRLADAILELRGHPAVRYAEANGYWQIAETIPDDPSYPSQYGFPIIDAPNAWDDATDASIIKIAVIDTGVQYDHPDLAANMWTNPDEIPGNGVDDDNNGYIDDVLGWDFVNDDNDPDDDHGHGTHCSGTVGAVTNNATGVAGVCWQAQIIPIKFLDSGGSGTWDDSVLAVEYAVSVGAQLSSNSWGGGGGSSALEDAIDLAGDIGHLFVAAAGNFDEDIDVSPFYPAAYDLPEIISVAATDSADNRASFSNYGKIGVDLAAPGVSILSTWIGDSYHTISGTSMACPHVAGVCNMLFAETGETSYENVKAWVMGGVDPVASMDGISVTGGRLNMRKTLDLAYAPIPPVGVMLSFRESGSAGGVTFAPEDIVHLDAGMTTFSMWFDGSDVLPVGVDVDAIARLDDGSLLLSLAGDGVSVPGLQGGPAGDVVDDEDLIRFFGTSYGDVTEGWFVFYFDGSDVSLTTVGENIRAVSFDELGNLHLSTRGKYDVGITGKNEDVLSFAPSQLGDTTAGTWSLLFDGRSSDVKLGKRGEQVIAYTWLRASGELALSTAKDFRVPGHTGQNDDVLLFTPTLLGPGTLGSFSLYFDGAALGLDPYNIDGLHIVE